MSGDDPDDIVDASPLDRIAQVLGVPIATFLMSGPAEPGNDTAVREMDDPAEALILLRLYARLKSPEARARCLAYIVHEATRDD